MIAKKQLFPKGLQWAAFDLLPDPVFCIDSVSHQLTWFNTALCDSLGYCPEELLDLRFGDICPQADIGVLEKIDNAASAIIRAGHRRKDGLLVPVEWHVACHILEGETSKQWIFVARNISHDDNHDWRLGDFHELGLLGHDPLTGLPNRRLFERCLERSMQLAEENDGYRFAVYFVDIDDFKEINDRMGHLVGDRVLCEVARRLVACVRPGDLAARFGGDEFTLLIDNLHHETDAEVVGRRILQLLEEPVLVDGEVLQIAASIGAVTGPHCHASAEKLLHEADRAMYRVKNSGGHDFWIRSNDIPRTPRKAR